MMAIGAKTSYHRPLWRLGQRNDDFCLRDMRVFKHKDWRNFAAVHHRLRPPLRPAPTDVARMRGALRGDDRSVLLLGVTPELAQLGEDLTAVDNSRQMVERVWPGNSKSRRAIIGDWAELPFTDCKFTAVVGDGSLNSAPGQTAEIIAEVKRVLRPGGIVAVRTFCSPEVPETLDDIERGCAPSWADNVHALKWRIAMSVAAGLPNFIIPVAMILNTFDELFPDRARLARRTGWSEDDISTLDAYKGASHSLWFPTLSSLLQLTRPRFESVTVFRANGYQLADRCPTVVWCKQ